MSQKKETKKRNVSRLLRSSLRKASTHADRLDPHSKARGIIGFHKDAAKGTFTGGGRKAARAHTRRKAQHRLIFIHTYNAVIIAAHARIGLVSGPLRQDTRIGGRNMLMGSHHKAGAAIAKQAHGVFL